MTTKQMPRPVALTITAALLVSACGTDEPVTEPLGQGAITAGGEVAGSAPATTGTTETTASSDATDQPVAAGTTGVPATDAPTTTDDPGGAQPAGLPPRPALDACVVLPVPDDGVYTVYEAGTAVITFTGGRLGLEGVQAADGWTVRVDEDDEDEVEIDFRRAGEVLDLEVEVDDGRVQAQVCADDD